MRSVFLLGSTGSIGTQALDVIRTHPAEFVVAGIGAGGGSVKLLAEQAIEFSVPVVAIADTHRIDDFVAAYCAQTHQAIPTILSGPDAMCDLVSQATGADDVVLNGMTGSVGLRPTLAALASGATLALANKESLVAGGALVKEALRWPGQIVPVDSEHSALAQALRSGRHNKGLCAPVLDGASEVRRLILTASGGPFRGKKRADLAHVTANQALNHPTWSMGPVVTINSSTLMNKGLELIEAAYLFDIPSTDIVPVIHPQSIIHSMVEFHDGSTIAQASPPDMRLPIALGLSWPRRLSDVAKPNRWDSPVTWTFEPIDHETFPALRLAGDAVATSGLHPAVMNAANEECVDAFLSGKIEYLDIVDIVGRVLEEVTVPDVIDLDAVLGTEQWARQRAHELMRKEA